MRFFALVAISSGLWITHAHGLEVKNTCGRDLNKMMVDDDNVEGHCEVVISDGGRQVKKQFKAEVVEDIEDGKPVAKIEMREFCATCGTEGTATKHLLDFAEINAWAARQAAKELAGGPDPDVLSNDCLIGRDDMPTTPDMMSCRLTTLRTKGSVKDANAYFAKNVIPRLQKLAISRDRADQMLLRKILSILPEFGVVGQSDEMTAVLAQFQAFTKIADEAARFEAAMKSPGTEAAARDQLTRNWKAMQKDAVSLFNAQAAALKADGVTEPAVINNGVALANIVKNLGFLNGNTPDAPGLRGASPREMFGTAGLARTAPTTAPMRTGGGTPAGMFHAR